MKKILRWIKVRSAAVKSSIAFYPAIIAIGFLFLSWLMLELDFSEWGKDIKRKMLGLSLKDASTARVIVSTISAGIMSLTVFSFSMVMIVLNQAASQMSNRVLSSMIENRFQQIVLGFYIGPIVYGLFLLSTIRDIHSGVYVPALSIYLLILLTVVDIFLFIYFLDYVTRSVKFETVIRRVLGKTMRSMKDHFISGDKKQDVPVLSPGTDVSSRETGYFQDINAKRLVELACEHDLVVSIIPRFRDYVIEGLPIMSVHGNGTYEIELLDEIASCADFYHGNPVELNADYGFQHLAEIGIKALSPGINDPATAVLCLEALTQLFAYRLTHIPKSVYKDENGAPRVILSTSSFEELFNLCIGAIAQYGKEDSYVQNAISKMISQLTYLDKGGSHSAVLRTFRNR